MKTRSDCPRCFKQIKPTDKSCPRCGHRLDRSFAAVKLIIGVAAAAALYICTHYNKPRHEPHEVAGDGGRAGATTNYVATLPTNQTNGSGTNLTGQILSRPDDDDDDNDDHGHQLIIPDSKPNSPFQP